MSLARTAFVAFALAAAAPAILALPLTAPASAQESTRFTQAAFESARKAGGPILVEVTAPWCPTCKAQKPILSKLLGEPRFAKMTVFNVDFDSQKDVLKMLDVRMQSTLIVYNAGAEVGRSTGTTDARAIEEQLGKSI